MIGDKVIRICLSCGRIYLDRTTNFTYIKPCKFCSGSTGFFETLNHFYNFVDKYSVDTNQIKDPQLLQTVCLHFNIDP